ncbi:MAG: hypothetical protein JSV88_24795 [Candidatus Aminicenantes bacterium]|nr:MAG: hypothetical protein JSV88_24795 [Candidatus Aminicenantes bacterium]
MPYSKDFTALTPETMDGLTQAIINVDQLASVFAINLTIPERKRMYTVGDRSYPFVEKCLDYFREHQEMGPSYLSLQQFENQWTLFSQLRKLSSLIEPVVEKLNDTCMAAGAEAFSSGLVFYKAAQNAAKSKKPGADAIVAELKKRYHRPRRSTSAQESNDTES